MNRNHTRASTPTSPQRGPGMENVSTNLAGRASGAEHLKRPSAESETLSRSRRGGRPVNRTFGPSQTDRTRSPVPPARTPEPSEGSRAPAHPGLPATITIHPAGRDRPGVAIRVREALIASAARELWKERGGNDLLNWLEAEMLVDDALRRLPE